MRAVQILACCVTTACASAPNFEAQRDRVLSSSEVLCFAQASPRWRDRFPAEAVYVDTELRERRVHCTAEMIAQGRQAILAQAKLEEDSAAAARAQNAQTADAAINFAGRLLQAIAVGAAAGAVMQATQPPPRQQVCQWQTNANGTGSMVCF